MNSWSRRIVGSRAKLNWHDLVHATDRLLGIRTSESLSSDQTATEIGERQWPGYAEDSLHLWHQAGEVSLVQRGQSSEQPRSIGGGSIQLLSLHPMQHHGMAACYSCQDQCLYLRRPKRS